MKHTPRLPAPLTHGLHAWHGRRMRYAVYDKIEKLGRKCTTNLSEVELGLLLVGDTLNLDEGGVRAGVALCALVAKDAALAVESVREGTKGTSASIRHKLHPSTDSEPIPLSPSLS